MKTAILQNADTPQIESTSQMLRAAGYRTMICSQRLHDELQRIGCDTVLSVQSMIDMGYDPLDQTIMEADLTDMERCDLFCEIKVRNIDKIRERWPRLKDKIAWIRVNGAQPEICPKGGDEVHLSCPIITACLWYGTERYRQTTKSPNVAQAQSSQEHEASRPVTLDSLQEESRGAKLGDNGMAYTMWPPYPRMGEYLKIDRKMMRRIAARPSTSSWESPYCVAHSAPAWGYGGIIKDCVDLGIRIYGNNAPAGQVPHSRVSEIAAKALCLVHLKSVDCPGWALYEAILAGCPVVTGRLLNSRMLAYDLLEDNVTCLEFGAPATLEYGRGPMELERCMADIKLALKQLADPEENLRIGEAGRQRLLELMWREDRDGNSFQKFMGRHFP